MTVADLRDILGRARQHGYAVGYFEAWDSYSLEAILETAEALESPAILGFGGAVTNPTWYEAGGGEALAALARGFAERATGPGAGPYNGAQTPAQALRGIR